ncbi:MULTISPECIES: type I restriction enzyme HsdR N-terminal domain-containing protein [Bacillus]|uniref:type I restriction enzyme HsdR N-terminal domain-containing protein n=1 Tax=Bacillus TaxID=1386 RepID=UPI002942BDCD|nr:type I restriction enzyme HsdR N-terminal domain-containing protein [Bacillus altitudinis]WOI43271.1 type I restriction enzyme HsdR N-terminal domain-containing protein [Bacillus altitudinis]
MIMKEADILHKILHPIVLQAGYRNEEVSLDYMITSNIGGGEIRLKPDIVLFSEEDKKTPLLVIEMKSSYSLTGEKLEKTIGQTLFYSKEIGLPIFAITDGISFYLYSENKNLLVKIDSLENERERLVDLLSKDNLKEFIGGLKVDKNKISSVIELEREWLSQIDEEVLFLEDANYEIKNIGRKVISYLGEKVFGKFCEKEEIPHRKVNLDSSFDFIVGLEKVEVKATLVDNKSNRNIFIYQQDKSAVTIICIAIYVDLDDEALLGYNFKHAEVIGYARTDELEDNGRTVRLIRQSELSPINKWTESVKGGVSR